MKGYLNKTENGGIITYNLHQQTDKPTLYNVVELLPDTNISNLVEGQEVDFQIIEKWKVVKLKGVEIKGYEVMETYAKLKI